jgi:hypothetical protein
MAQNNFQSLATIKVQARVPAVKKEELRNIKNRVKKRPPGKAALK